MSGSTRDHQAGDEQAITTTLGEDRGTSPGTKVFFEGFFGIIEPTMESLPVLLWTEGDGSFSLDDILLQQAF